MRKIIVVLSYFFISIECLFPQVTIGSKEEPAIGAILQLKDIGGVTDGNANATKGLSLPRVRLSSRTDLFPSFSENPTSNDQTTLIPTEDYDTQAKKDLLDKQHIGLMVYNVTNGILDFCKGVYIWDGSKWQETRQQNLETSTSNTLTDRDGNVYKIQTFGSAGTWMLENLRTKTTRCGNKLSLITIPEANNQTFDNLSIAYPNDNIQYANQYGMLYSWAAATNGKGGFNGAWAYPEDQSPLDGAKADLVGTNHKTSQGICPAGWHLPSEYEWFELFEYIHNNYEKYTTSSFLPADNSYTTPWSDAWKTGFTNTTKGYTGLFIKSPNLVENSLRSSTNGASKLDIDGGFNGYLIGDSMISDEDVWGSYTSYWSSSQGTDSYGATGLFFNWTKEGVGINSYARKRLLSVRCMKD